MSLREEIMEKSVWTQALWLYQKYPIPLIINRKKLGTLYVQDVLTIFQYPVVLRHPHPHCHLLIDLINRLYYHDCH